MDTAQVNNAGIILPLTCQTGSMENYDLQMNINLRYSNSFLYILQIPKYFIISLI